MRKGATLIRQGLPPQSKRPSKAANSQARAGILWQRIVEKFRDTRERIDPWQFSIQTSEHGTQGRKLGEAVRRLRCAK